MDGLLYYFPQSIGNMKIEINRQKDDGKPKGAIDEASLLSAKALDDILGILGRKEPTPVKEGGQDGDDACNGELDCFS